MADTYWNKVKARTSGSGVGTSTGVTVTLAAVAADIYFCTGIQASGDAAAVVTIESPASTVLWRKRFAGAFTMNETFPPGFLQSSAKNQAMLVKISASTSNCEANIQAATIQG